MQLPSLSSLLVAASTMLTVVVNAAPLANAGAAPLIPDGTTDTLLGPAPYAELKALVAARDLRLKERGLEKRAVGGLYLCENYGFGGSCYYGVYEAYKKIQPDPYWVARISSVGPDTNTQCLIYNNAICGSRPEYNEYVQSFQNPGGNLPTQLNDKVGCFICYGSS